MGKKLPSEGLVLRYDPENEYLAVGTRNGDRFLYSVEECIKMCNIGRVIEKYTSLS